MTNHTETLNDLREMELARFPASSGYVVVHPLHDAPEVKRNADHLGAMKLGTGSRIALGSLRFYIVAIMLIGGYRVFEMIHGLRH